MRISDWSSDVCSSDLLPRHVRQVEVALGAQVVHDGSQRAHGAVRTARAGGDALPVAGVLHARLGADGPALAVLVAVAPALRRPVDPRPGEGVAGGGPPGARIGGLRRPPPPMPPGQVDPPDRKRPRPAPSYTCATRMPTLALKKKTHTT